MMKRLSFLLSLIFVLALVPWSGHAASTGTHTDLDNDVIDPVIAQNEQTKQFAHANIPPADIHTWSLNFDSTLKKITLVIQVNGVIPRHNADYPATNFPPGFVGASYRAMFTSSTQSIEQVTGVSCASYADEDTSPNAKTKQDVNYAKCTNARQGPYKSPNFKLFFGYSVRENPGAGTAVHTEGAVQWGIFDHYAQSLTFRDVKSDDPCTVGSGYTLGGGVRSDTTQPCPWGAKITSWASGKDQITVEMPYSPNWVVPDDLDNNAVANDENRHYDLVSVGGTVNGIVANTWVDQVAGLPQPFCDPTGSTCGTNADPTNCVDPQADPPDEVDAGCTTGAVNDTVADYQRWSGAPFDCTVNGKRAGECIQEIGGFVYQVDWAGAGTGSAVNNAYSLGLFSWPVPGYVPNQNCPYQYAVPFVNDGRVPDGVALYADNDRRTGYTGLIMTYGVRLATDDSYHTANGRRGGYTNVVVPAPARTGPLATAQTIDNPVPTTYVANPLVNNNSCSYTPFVGSRFVDANGVSTTS